MKKFVNGLFFLALFFFSRDIFTGGCESLQRKCVKVLEPEIKTLARNTIADWPEIEGTEHFITYPMEWQRNFLTHLKFLAENRWPVKTGINFLLSKSIDDLSEWIDTIKISTDGKLIVFGSRNKVIRLFLLGDDQQYHFHQALESHRGWITSLVITPDKSTILSASRDGMLKIWVLGADGFYYLNQSINQGLCSIDTVDISLDKSMIIFGSRIGSFDQYIKIYEIGSDNTFYLKQEIYEKSLGDPCIVISGDKKVFVCGYEYGHVKIFRLQEGGSYLEVQNFQEIMTNIRSVAMSEDGHVIVYGGPDIPIKVLNLGEDDKYLLKQILNNKDNEGWFDCVYMSKDKKIIVAGFNNGIIEVWMLGGEGYFLSDILRGHNNCVLDVSSDLNNKIIVSSDNKGSILIWERLSLLASLDLSQTLDFLRAHCS